MTNAFNSFHTNLRSFVQPMGYCPNGVADRLIQFSPTSQPMPQLLPLAGSKILPNSVPGMPLFGVGRRAQDPFQQQWIALHDIYEDGRLSQAISDHEKSMPGDGGKLRTVLNDKFGGYTLREIMGAELNESERADLLELAGMLYQDQGVMKSFHSLLASGMIYAKLSGELGNRMAETAFAFAGDSLKRTLHSYLAPIMYEAAAEVWGRGKRSKAEINVHRQLAAHGWKVHYKGDEDFESILLRLYRAMWNALQGGAYTLYSRQNEEYAEYAKDAGMLEDAGDALARSAWAQSLAIVTGVPKVNDWHNVGAALKKASSLFERAGQGRKARGALLLAEETEPLGVK